MVWFVAGLPAQISCPSIGDDGFSATGTCCAVATPNIPTFPTFEAVTASYICVQNCATSTVFAVTVTLPSPATSGPTCDAFTATLTVLPVAPATAPTIVVLLHMKYSRTWTVTDSFGRVRQVWRFLVNGEASYGAADPTPCPKPMCTLVPFNPWFHGFIDYASEPTPATPGPAQDCAIRMVLGHQAGCLAHFNNPTFNAQALAPTSPNRHDDYAFFIVAPAPFAPATTVAPLPPSSLIDVPPGAPLDAIRTNLSVIPAATMCLEEDRMSAFKSTTVLRNCYCTPMGPGALPLHYHQDIIGNGTCFPVPVFQSIANLPTAPPTGFVQEYVGQWGLAAGLWPFKAHAWLANGVFDYSDITCMFPSAQPSFHFVRGGTIAYDTGPPTLALYGGPGGLQLMTDVSNSLLLAVGGMTQASMVGTTVDAALLFQISR